MARTLRSLPLVGNYASLLQVMQTWRANLSKTLVRPNAPSIPWNFRITNVRGGLQLDWNQVKSADGYLLLRSATGDFSSPTVIPLRNSLQTTYVDFFAKPTKMYYRLQATSGTTQQPHSVLGNATGTLSATSIDATDTTTTSSTSYDTSTTQSSQTGGGSGSYNGFGSGPGEKQGL